MHRTVKENHIEAMADATAQQNLGFECRGQDLPVSLTLGHEDRYTLQLHPV